VAATDPTQPALIDVPPSGAVCGIYARSDVQRGVWKAPANETVTGALALQRDVRFGEQEVLNPLGINCVRALPGRGIRVWGARTISSDPEWMYVNIRRYFLYLEASIDRGTQWAVFEPNGEALWANVRTAVSDFLYNEWVSGALLGGTPKEAFFVRCDRTTMTQNDLDNGRLICLIGVAAIKPAEFVILRIGQKTADARG
jgi:phage tail sheath protein FI